MFLQRLKFCGISSFKLFGQTAIISLLIEQQFRCQDAEEQVHMKLILCGSSSFKSQHSLCLGEISGTLFFFHSTTTFVGKENTWTRARSRISCFLVHLQLKLCQSHSCSMSLFLLSNLVCKSAWLLLVLSP